MVSADTVWLLVTMAATRAAATNMCPVPVAAPLVGAMRAIAMRVVCASGKGRAIVRFFRGGSLRVNPVISGDSRGSRRRGEGSERVRSAVRWSRK